MKDKILEQKKVIRIGCWKFKKFINSHDPDQANCPFGYIELQPNCKNCIWFEVKKVGYGKRPLVTDREISEGEIEHLRFEYERNEKVQKAEPIRIEGNDDGIHRLNNNI